MPRLRLFLILVALTVTMPVAPRCAEQPQSHDIKIGNYLVSAPYGIAFIIDDATGFVINPVWDQPGPPRYGMVDPAQVAPAVTAPDFSFFQATFPREGAQVRFTWGRVGTGAVAARLETDRPVALSLSCPTVTWPHFHASYTATADGFEGYAIKPSGEFIPIVFRSSPEPALVRADVTSDAEIVLSLDPKQPTYFVAGVGELPPLESVDGFLDDAQARYAATRIASEGDWGDFLSAIPENLNNYRLYSSDNKRTVITIGRGWWMRTDPDLFPYFIWDLSFNSMLSSLEDPAAGRETIRAVLSFQTPDGRIPSFSHWVGENRTYVTTHRSMPPVTSLCVWKMHQRNPDADFLAEVYPALVRWHDWWLKARDGNKNGLLEWGSEQRFFQGAQYETGWDDNVHYEGAALAGTTMNADSVDLSSLWSLDAEHLALIARALGKEDDARRFESDHEQMNKRINDRLWNEELGVYCSRFWEVPKVEGPALDHSVVFSEGLEAIFYGDAGLTNEMARRRHASLDFSWDKAAPIAGMSAERWSARWTGPLTVPQSGLYRLRFCTVGEKGADMHVTLDGKLIDDWTYDAMGCRYVDLTLEAGQAYPFALEYFKLEETAALHVSVKPLSPGEPGSDWLTRVTPMNFYPLICGAPDRERADRVLSMIYREDKFWLPYLIPTVSKDDPVWYMQGYWLGNVWPPCNYLIWKGLQRYADSERQAEYARRSVNLFMRNWTDMRLNGENYRSTNGSVYGMPHYSWGTLLCEIGLEALVHAGPDFEPVPAPDGVFKEKIVLRRVPFGGKLYRIEARDGKVTVTPEE